MNDIKKELFPKGKPTPEEFIEAIVRYILAQKEEDPAD